MPPIARFVAATLLCATALVASKAEAKAEPKLLYFVGSLAPGWHVQTVAERDSLFGGGDWTTSTRTVGELAPWNFDTAGIGVGVGYSGLNAQFDFRNAGDLQEGLLTIGLRANVQLARFELWGRLAAGPVLLVDFSERTLERDTTAGLITVVEGGLDYFVIDERLALGLRALGTPSFTWPARFAVAFDIGLGARLLL